MKYIINTFIDGFRQAFLQLGANKLRAFLSLLGITIGVFCIIGVQTAIHSLETDLREGMKELGEDVVYVSKMPWEEGGPQRNYWKYLKRPNPSYDDFLGIEKRLKSADKIAFSSYLGSKTAKFLSNSIERTTILGVTYDYADVFNFNFSSGRYFSKMEYDSGSSGAIIGRTIANDLFPGIDPVGKTIKVNGLSLKVLGVLKKNGNSSISFINFDEIIFVSTNFARHLANIKSKNPWSTVIVARKGDWINMEDFKENLRSVLRRTRRIKPKEEDDFALNETSILSNLFDEAFASLSIIGMLVGGFSLFVGMFGVANIMFVNVKERTSIIGVKKAIGAKRSVILFEFLVEAVTLCIIGGVIGLLFVFALAKIAAKLIEFNFYLSIGDISLGFGLSIVIGILSGLIPAIIASKLDPVEAMRR